LVTRHMRRSRQRPHMLLRSNVQATPPPPPPPSSISIFPPNSLSFSPLHPSSSGAASGPHPPRHSLRLHRLDSIAISLPHSPRTFTDIALALSPVRSRSVWVQISSLDALKGCNMAKVCCRALRFN
jgi:hypothetical protein